jgi:hypothetical protein
VVFGIRSQFEAVFIAHGAEKEGYRLCSELVELWWEVMVTARRLVQEALPKEQYDQLCDAIVTAIGHDAAEILWTQPLVDALERYRQQRLYVPSHLGEADESEAKQAVRDGPQQRLYELRHLTDAEGRWQGDVGAGKMELLALIGAKDVGGKLEVTWSY